MTKRKRLVLKKRWAGALMMAAMLLGAQLGVGLVARCQEVGSVSEKTARAYARGARLLANAPAEWTAPEETKSARLFTGKRDPFKLPPPPDKGKEGQSGGALPPGRRGLVIGQLRLEGVVREDAGHSMIAVVTNQTNLAYFLRVHDEVYNGVVSVITENSIRFSEKRLDNNGRLETREIVLKLGSPAREER